MLQVHVCVQVYVCMCMLYVCVCSMCVCVCVYISIYPNFSSQPLSNVSFQSLSNFSIQSPSYLCLSSISPHSYHPQSNISFRLPSYLCLSSTYTWVKCGNATAPTSHQNTRVKWAPPTPSSLLNADVLTIHCIMHIYVPNGLRPHLQLVEV